ncbi:hypothetical protein V6N13_000792 [Hibiscus sabdariffa]
MGVWLVGKKGSLSFAARLVLVNSVLSSLPIYYMGIYLMPKSVMWEIDRLRWSFLWGGMGEQHKLCRNLSLLAKWAWRYATEGESLWKALILAKYGPSVYSWRWQSSRPCNMSIVWRQIVQVQDEDCVGRHMGFHCFSWAVGRGASILFWLDKWCLDDALCYLFPRLSRLARLPLALVAQMAVDDSLVHDEWLSFFKRDLRPFELHQLGELRRVIGVWRLLSTVPDRLIWEPAVHGGFSVKELSSRMHSFGLSGDVVGAFRVWDLGVPPKIQCFLWFVLLDRLPTQAMLRASGVQLGEISLACVFCGMGCDEIQHILVLGASSRVYIASGVSWVVQRFYGRCGWQGIKSFFVVDALDCFLDESQWWGCPLDCAFPVAERDVRRGIEWCPPMARSWKFNVDGSTRDKLGPTSCGGVLRDGEGQIIAIFLGLLGVLDSNVAELRAIAFALDVLVAGCWKGVSSFIIEFDSAVAISWILHKERRPWRLGRWFRGIGGACLSLSCVCFNHVLREANAVADALAKGGVDRSNWLYLCNTS